MAASKPQTRPWRLIQVCFVWALATFGVSAPLRGAEGGTPPSTSSPRPAIPYVPTRHDTVKDLLWLAGVGTNDVVYDLGSGDGRVVIAAARDFGASRAVGIEIDPRLVRESRDNAAAAGVADRVEFIQGDLLTNDFSQASVVVLYLGHGANLDLRAQLVRTLKPGARVVSHQFGMGEWTADKQLDVRTILLGMYGEMVNEFRTNPDVPDFDSTGSRARHDVVSLWVVPAPVAGVWRGPVSAGAGARELKLALHQRISGVSGSFEFQASATNLSGYVQADLWGDHLRCWCIPTNHAAFHAQLWFEGHCGGDTLEGSLWMPEGTNTLEFKWAGRRQPTDFTGTWEWAGPSNSPVQLRIERRGGQLAATYTDKNRLGTAYGRTGQPIPVTDFYDFGGGLYFTLLLGLEGTRLSGGSRRAGPEDGWLIGEAIAQENTLSGTIAFYPYRRAPDSPGLIQPSPPPPGRQEWHPRRVGP